jgi:hypothetical protein
MKIEQTQCYETSAIKHHNPKDYTQHLEHGESLKSRIYFPFRKLSQDFSVVKYLAFSPCRLSHPGCNALYRVVFTTCTFNTRQIKFEEYQYNDIGHYVSCLKTGDSGGPYLEGIEPVGAAARCCNGLLSFVVTMKCYIVKRCVHHFVSLITIPRSHVHIYGYVPVTHVAYIQFS